jgi:methylmalonyl-CoA mutase cobalamin-binding domain/chain
MLILGGTVPPGDVSKLKEAGISGVFGPGSSIKTIASFIFNEIEKNGSLG